MDWAQWIILFISLTTFINKTHAACTERSYRIQDQGRFTLQNERTVIVGRPEICYDNVYTPLCTSALNSTSAQEACASIAGSATVIGRLGAAFGNQGLYTSSVNTTQSGIIQYCNGSSSCIRLNDQSGCPSTNSYGIVSCYFVSSRDCSDSLRAGSTQSISLPSTQQLIRVRPEICTSFGVYADICDEGITSNVRQVICDSLYPGSRAQSSIYNQAQFLQSTNNLYFNNVTCSEVNSNSCTSNEEPSFDCPTSPLIVECIRQECSNGTFRLVQESVINGPFITGVIETCINNQWTAYCNVDENNSLLNEAIKGELATRMCTALDYTGGEVINSSSLTSSALQTLTNISCSFTGNMSIEDSCTYKLDNNISSCNEHFVIRCAQSPAKCSVNPPVQLFDNRGQIISSLGLNITIGYLGICQNNITSTICSSALRQQNITQNCRQIGLGSLGIIANLSVFNINNSRAFDRPLTSRGLISIMSGTLSEANSSCIDNEGITPIACIEGVSQDCQSGQLLSSGGSFDGVLPNGTTYNTTRLNICHLNISLPLCSEAVSLDIAQMYCNMTNPGTSALIGQVFGTPSDYSVPPIQSIGIKNVTCTTSSNQLRCFPTNDIISSNCDSGYAIITCATTINCTNGEIRLVGGSTNREGRVEVCNNGVWGTVCDDLWDYRDAQVVCRQLNINGNAIAYGSAHFGRGSGPILLDNVQCNGNEQSLTNCTHITSHNCIHSEDAGVSCGNIPTCSHGAVRLVNGSVTTEGRVEVCINGVWGTVCDDFWSGNDAVVVCRQLGFSGTAVAIRSAFFGQGTGPIFMDNVLCSGTEQYLTNCSHITNHNCRHDEDAGVRCTRGSTNREGRVEVLINGVWGTVCDDLWDYRDAQVVCRQLNINGSAIAYGSAHFGRGSGPILLDNVQCNGNEQSLTSCTHITNDNCIHSEDAGVSCGIVPTCNHGTVRLVNGSVPTEGRVEVCINGVWGTVCDDFWSDDDADVVCRQLGYTNGTANAIGSAFFGRGTGPIFMDDVLCSGTEQSLTNCRHVTDHNCFHFEDAGVRCSVPTGLIPFFTEIVGSGSGGTALLVLSIIACCCYYCCCSKKKRNRRHAARMVRNPDLVVVKGIQYAASKL